MCIHFPQGLILLYFSSWSLNSICFYYFHKYGTQSQPHRARWTEICPMMSSLHVQNKKGMILLIVIFIAQMHLTFSKYTS